MTDNDNDEDKITRGGCCVFHDIGLCTEDIINSFLKRGQSIEAIKLMKHHGFTLKEAKGLVEEVINKRYGSMNGLRDFLRKERRKK